MNTVTKSEEFMNRVSYIGKDVLIFIMAVILKPEMIEIADGVLIDDYTRIEGGEVVKICGFVLICAFASVYGGGHAEIHDYCGITQGARLITGTEQPKGIMTAAAQ